MTNSTSLVKYTDTVNTLLKSNLESLGKSGLNLYVSGFNIQQMLLGCEFNGNPCSLDDFYVYHDFNYGNCYRFNGNDVANYRIKQTKKPGWQNGLRLELYTGDQGKQKKELNKKIKKKIL